MFKFSTDFLNRSFVVIAAIVTLLIGADILVNQLIPFAFKLKGILFLCGFVGTLFVAKFFFTGTRISAITDFVNKHFAGTILLIFAFAILVRIFLVFCILPENFRDIPGAPGGDCPTFYRTIIDYANGNWTVNKSWTTIFFYGWLIRIFGANWFVFCGINFLVQTIGALAGTLLCKRVAGKIAGTLFCFAFLCLPTQIMFSLTIYSDTIFLTFILLTLLALHFAWREQKIWKSAIFFVGTCIFTWGAIWSRANGIVLFIAIPMILMCAAILRQISWKKFVAAILTIAVCFGIGAGTGFFINQQIDGSKTIFCSSDSWWPRLYGSDIEKCGSWKPGEKERIRQLYIDDHPDEAETIMAKNLANRCPVEFVPYIEKEIHERWAQMSLGDFVIFQIRKNHNLLAGTGAWRIELSEAKKASSLINVASKFTILIIVILLIWGSFEILRERQAKTFEFWLIPIFIVGNLCLFTMTEVAGRYMLIWFPLLTIFLAEFFESKIQKMTNK